MKLYERFLLGALFCVLGVGKVWGSIKLPQPQDDTLLNLALSLKELSTATTITPGTGAEPGKGPEKPGPKKILTDAEKRARIEEIEKLETAAKAQGGILGPSESEELATLRIALARETEGAKGTKTDAEVKADLTSTLNELAKHYELSKDDRKKPKAVKKYNEGLTKLDAAIKSSKDDLVQKTVDEYVGAVKKGFEEARTYKETRSCLAKYEMLQDVTRDYPKLKSVLPVLADIASIAIEAMGRTVGE